ncbi:MAG: bifunctional DNA-formamidopyrimidine glycosylase/DNA-(apurinic or apyrimidinic site) lyase [Candidatus Hodarchaeales archaeon]|jgi:formamidopyrimidine-DNA glycosylase
MPEGPEVESVRRELISRLTNKQVAKIQLTPLSQKYPKYTDKQYDFNQFSGKKLSKIVRFGKFLVWQFVGHEPVILNHLGMSGKFCFFQKNKELSSLVNHPKVIILMKTPPHVVFDDTRNFGQFKVVSSIIEVENSSPIRYLGIDGLASPFPIKEFLDRIESRHYKEKPIGEVLLNQRLVAGVGNIYKTESLFLAGLNPLRNVESLSKSEKKDLGNAIGETLQKALKDSGSTMDFQPYTSPTGLSGEAQRWHKVYRREGKPCQDCGTEIERIIQNKRSTFFCPNCQPKISS